MGLAAPDAARAALARVSEGSCSGQAFHALVPATTAPHGVEDIGCYLWASFRLEAPITHDEGATGISGFS